MHSYIVSKSQTISVSSPSVLDDQRHLKDINVCTMTVMYILRMGGTWTHEVYVVVINTRKHYNMVNRIHVSVIFNKIQRDK